MVGETLVIQCAGCYTIKQPDGTFQKVGSITYTLPLASHSYCPKCLKTIRNDFEKYKQLKREKACQNTQPQYLIQQP